MIGIRDVYDLFKTIYKSAKEYMINKDIRVFFKKYRKYQLLILVPPKDIDLQIKGTITNDYLGMANFRSFCDKYRINTTLTKANCVSQNDCKNNLLSLAGPIPNDKTRFFFDFEEIKYCFGGKNEHSIIDKKSNKDLYSSEITEGKIKTDYGIITRMKNPYNKDNDVLITAGCYGFGTQAAIESLAEIPILKFLNKQKHYYFQVIVKCKVDSDSNISNPEIMEHTFVNLY